MNILLLTLTAGLLVRVVAAVPPVPAGEGGGGGRGEDGVVLPRHSRHTGDQGALAQGHRHRQD